MMRTAFNLLLISCVVALTSVGGAADAVDKEVQPIVDAIKSKLAGGGRLTVDDFKAEFKKLETLAVQRKQAGKETGAGPLFVIGEVCDVIGYPIQAVAAFERVAKEYPETELARFATNNLAILLPQAQMQKAREALVIGAKFPDFQKTSLDGKPMSVSGLKGKVVLVDFWATFCPPCMASLPELKRVYAKYRKHGFEILGINEDYSPEQLPRAVAEHDLTWPQYYDADDELTLRYGANMLPEVYLLDREGRIIGRDEDLKGDKLEPAVRKALGLKNDEK